MGYWEVVVPSFRADAKVRRCEGRTDGLVVLGSRPAPGCATGSLEFIHEADRFVGVVVR